MKFRLTFKRFISIALIIGASIGIYFIFFKKSTDTNTKTITSTVTRGNVSSSIKITGTAKLINEQQIRFNQIGKVTKINFNEGDHVKQGDIIAELDSTDAMNQIKQSQISLNDAKIKLAQDLKPAEQKDILSAQASFDKSQSDIGIAQTTLASLKIQRDNKLTDLQNQIQASQADIVSKTAQLDLAGKQLNLLAQQEGKNISDVTVSTDTTISSAFSDERRYLIDAQTNLTTVDQIFGVSETNKNINADFETFLSAKNSTYKNNTENDWLKANELLVQANTAYATLDGSTATSTQVQGILTQIQSLYDALIITGRDATDAVNASIPNSTYPQSQIDSQYSSMLQVVSSAQSDLSQIKTTLSNLQTSTDPNLQKLQSNTNIAKQQSTVNDASTALKNAQNDLTSLQNTLAFTTTDYENQIKQQEANIQNLQNSAAINQATVDFIKRGATVEQIALDKDSIQKQALDLEQAQTALNKNYWIEAPFDGIVRQIDFRLGDNIIADDSKYIYLDNPNLLEITANLDQIEIAKVKVGQPAEIVFDAFPTKTFTGTVSLINPTPIQDSGVVSYEIKVTMDKGKSAIYSGMTSKMTLVVQEKKDVLNIPTSFIQKRRNISSVTLQDGSEKTITTGLSTPTRTEVIDGLQEGDIITRTITITTGTGTTQPRSLFGGGGGGHFGGGGGGGGHTGG